MKQEIARDPDAGRTKPKVSSLPFSGVPHQSVLFLKYQQDPRALKKYYPNAAESFRQISSFAAQVLTNYRTDRNALCDALTAINRDIGTGAATMANIARLREAETVAVVTGQQPGLFTGPLYTIYKALTAVKMAEASNQMGTRAVPVFWAATEDHDFDEVAEAFVTARTGEVARIAFEPEGHLEDTPVGSIRIDGSMAGTLDKLFDQLPHTEFSDGLHQKVASAWSAGAGFGQAFLKTLTEILSGFGIIFLDPMDERIKSLSAPIYAAAIERSDQIVKAVIDTGRELEKDGFHIQVSVEPDYFPLFWHDDQGRRKALRRIGDGRYRVKGERLEFQVPDLAEMAASEPRRFSPGVMLRPVVQDYLLPTLCYVGGAAEVAYFAQNAKVYEILDRPVTTIFHRQSFTIIEAKHRRLFERFNLRFEQLFEGMESATLKIAAGETVPEMPRLFADVEERINTELNRLDQNVSQIDPTLAANLARRRAKMIYHIAAMKRKTLLAAVRKDETLHRQIHGLFTDLLPNGALQERSINVFTYLNKFGPRFVDWIYDAIDLDDKGHRIVEF